jgi:hypothetical protein
MLHSVVIGYESLSYVAVGKSIFVEFYRIGMTSA